MSASALVTLLTLAPGMAHAAPSRPDPDEVAEIAIDAAVELDAEILSLVALGAFGADTPNDLQAVHDEYADFIADLDGPGLIGWTVEADRQGAELLSVLREMGVSLTPALERALGPLTQADLDALDSGQPMSGDHLLYVRARIQLEELSAGRVPMSDPAPTAPLATVDQTVTTNQTVTPDQTVITTAPATSSSGTLPLWWLTVAIGVAAIGVIALVASLRRGGLRRVTDIDEPVDQFDLLAEAARRMTGALDDGEIARVALDQAMQMTRARHGAFVSVDGTGLTPVATSGDVFMVRAFTGGLLSRVADTGQTVRRIAHDEPAITSLPAAVLAAPVIGGGRVTAIVFLVRPEATPFVAEEERALERLTPVVASALAAASKHEDATALSRIDPLTGLANRRSLDADLGTLQGAPASGRSFAVVMVDVDHFKQFNDRNGHAAGDAALRAVAEALRGGVRDQDRVYRYGGEEFSLVLPDVDRAEAEQVAERVRELVQQIDLPGSAQQPGGALSVSVGVALVPSIEPASALHAADRALYDAKSAGRNRVVVTEPVS